jgi:flagellar motor protein MotB
MLKLSKNFYLFLIAAVLNSCAIIMPRNPGDPAIETANSTSQKLSFKTRPTIEPYDPVDRAPKGYSNLTAPKIIANPVAALKIDSGAVPKIEYNTSAYYIKKIKKEINIRLSYPTDWKGNYYKFRKSMPLSKIEMINDKDTCYIAKYTLTEVEDKRPYHISMVLDHSGSMGHDRCVDLQDAVSMALKESETKNKISLIKFDSEISFEGKSKDSAEMQKILYQKIGMEGFGGATSIYDALNMSLDSLKGDTAYRPLVILFSDGYENSSKVQDIKGVVAKAKTMNVPVFTIAFGGGADEQLLRGIANETNGLFFLIYDRSEFKDLLNNELFLLNHYYDLRLLPCSFDYDKIRFEGFTDKGNRVTGEKFMKGLQETLAMNLNFDFDRTNLNAKNLEEVKKIATYLKNNPDQNIIVTGHTDNAGSVDYNLDLSIKRAEAVKRALINFGIDQKRVQAFGRGETMPYVPNDTEENRSRNRRIEIELVKK